MPSCSVLKLIRKSSACSPPARRAAPSISTLGASGRSADFARRSYGAALHYFTGSKAHNIAVRTLGVERGLRISEYGVFRVPKGKKVEAVGVEEGERFGGVKEEERVQGRGMDWVPPELRENRGEIQAAQKHNLPELIVLDDIRGDLHLHSKWTDGSSSDSRDGARPEKLAAISTARLRTTAKRFASPAVLRRPIKKTTEGNRASPGEGLRRRGFQRLRSRYLTGWVARFAG